MIKKNIGIFALFFSIFILFAFLKNASADILSSIISRQFTDACKGRWIMEKNFDGIEFKFENIVEIIVSSLRTGFLLIGLETMLLTRFIIRMILR